MLQKDKRHWVQLIEQVNAGKMSLDDLYVYEGFPDTPEHAALIKEHLKVRRNSA